MGAAQGLGSHNLRGQLLRAELRGSGRKRLSSSRSGQGCGKAALACVGHHSAHRGGIRVLHGIAPYELQPHAVHISMLLHAWHGCWHKIVRETVNSNLQPCIVQAEPSEPPQAVPSGGGWGGWGAFGKLGATLTAAAANAVKDVSELTESFQQVSSRQRIISMPGHHGLLLASCAASVLCCFAHHSRAEQKHRSSSAAVPLGRMLAWGVMMCGVMKLVRV